MRNALLKTRVPRTDEYRSTDSRAEDWSAVTEPWRNLESSAAIRFVTRKGRELDPDSVADEHKAEIIAAIEARRAIVRSSVWSAHATRALFDNAASLELVVHGFLTVRELQPGDFRFEFELSRKRSCWTPGELCERAGALEKLARINPRLN